MSRSNEPDDGLEEFADSPLVRALRAPGTAAELADEERHVAAYGRFHRPRGGGRVAGRAGRVVGRIGVGGVALLAGIGLSGGVAAAAYTQRLPDPVQAIAHDAFGGVGVPPERSSVPPPPPSTSAKPATETMRPSESTSETGRPSRPTPRPDRSRTAEAKPSGSTSPSGTASPSGTDLPSPTEPTGSGTPTGSPSGTPSDGDPTAPGGVSTTTRATLTVSVRRVVSGGRASVTGRLTDRGEPVADQQVWLVQRHLGEQWRRTASAVTDADGTVTFATGTLTATTDYRIEAAAGDEDDPDRLLRSPARRIGVQPVLTLSADGSTVIVHTDGADAGDAITLSRRVNGRLVRVGTRRLDAGGTATYDLAPLTGRVRVLVRVLRTSEHIAVKRWITLRIPKEPKPGPKPTPGPSSSAIPSGSPSASPTGEPSGSADSGTRSGS